MKIEFYLDKTGTLIRVIWFKVQGNKWQSFDDLTDQQIEQIFMHLAGFPIVRKAMIQLAAHFDGDRRAMLRQFIKCNWADLDAKWDITDKQLHFEDVPCAHKGADTCPFKAEGVVCIHKAFTKKDLAAAGHLAFS